MLESVPGVESCEIDYGSKTATIEVNSNVDVEKVVGALKGGYSGKVKQ